MYLDSYDIAWIALSEWWGTPRISYKQTDNTNDCSDDLCTTTFPCLHHDRMTSVHRFPFAFSDTTFFGYFICVHR
jgi:hypothetical protein